MNGQAKYYLHLHSVVEQSHIPEMSLILIRVFQQIKCAYWRLCLMIPRIHNRNWLKVYKSRMSTNTMKLQTSGITMPAAYLHRLQSLAQEILNI
jgi:hypothetical protein